MKAPNHLSMEAKKIWGEITAEYDVDDAAGRRILMAALEARDRADQARQVIDHDGLTIIGRDGQIKAHPLLTVERDARAAFLAGLKALQLEIKPSRPVGRPPHKI